MQTAGADGACGGIARQKPGLPGQKIRRMRRAPLTMLANTDIGKQITTGHHPEPYTETYGLIWHSFI